MKYGWVVSEKVYIGYMGRQGGMARFLGTCCDINGYADDGKAIWRAKSELNKRKWLKMPSMEGQRRAAHVFGAASMLAGRLWSRLPEEMRRLADGGGFNRLVGTLVGLMEAGEVVTQPRHWRGGRAVELVDVDGLRGLDLSVDSSGPHRVVKSEQRKGKSGNGLDVALVGDVSTPLRSGRHDKGFGYRLTGIRSLMEEIDLAVGDRAGKRSGKFVVADKLQSFVVREEVDYCKLGSMEGWLDKGKGVDHRLIWTEGARGRGAGKAVWKPALDHMDRWEQEGKGWYGSRRFGLSYKGGELHRRVKPGWILRMDWLSVDTPEMPWRTDENCLPFTAKTPEGWLSRLEAPGLYFRAPEAHYRHYLVDFPSSANSKLRSRRLGTGSDEFLGAAYSSLLGRTVDSPVEEGSEQAPTVFSELPIRRSSGHGLKATRRVRVWVHAVEVQHPEWCKVNGKFYASGQRHVHDGSVTPWMVGETGSWADDIPIDCGEMVLKAGGGEGSGMYVVFTAVEVAEKRGRHWVRLPWCCKMRVQDVVFVGEEEAMDQVEGNVNELTLGVAQSDGRMAIAGRTLETCPEGVPLCAGGAEASGEKVGVVRNRAGP
jgi:hypothetical protein